MADDGNHPTSNPRTTTTASRPEAEEPAASGVAQPSKPSSVSVRPPVTVAPLRKASATSLAMSPAAGMSPRTSRNNSPIRKDKPPPLAGPLSTQPSAAAIQRALSSSNAPQLQHSNSASDTTSRTARGQKSDAISGENSPQWPVSPRVKSPPPLGAPSRKNSTTVQKRSESSNAPAINVQSATPQSASSISPPAKTGGSEVPKTDQTQQILTPLPKGPSRGPGGKSTLETVQENSGDSVTEPSPAAILAAADLRPLTRLSQEDMKKPKRDHSRTDLDKHMHAGESGSESAGNRSDHRRGRRPSSNSSSTNIQRPKQANPKNSYSTINSAKTRQGDARQNMTVETETVLSIPQSVLTTGDRYDHNSSVKLKASNETIRPRKERKKTERKARSVNQGTAPTKADLFEARVANAVDEANTSDSDETFVYESNPPEHQRRQRHHSRTPSVTSSHSTAEQSRGSVRHNDDRRVGGKRSMKFSNVYTDVDSHDNKDGTVRSHTPRHIGRFGRGGHHSANHEPDSPFTKMRNNQLSAQRQSRPTSPGSPPMMSYRPNALFGRKQEHSFDLEADGADDERTPLINSHRPHRHIRNLHMRRLAGDSMPYVSEPHSYIQGRTRWCSGRAGACFLTSLMAVLVMVSAFGFVFSSNRPLYDVKVRRIQNVLATKQELMFDLVVTAVNPNALSISAGDLDIDIFAKSKYVGGGGHEQDGGTQTLIARIPRLRRHDLLTNDVEYNPNPSQDPSGHWNPPDPAGHDHGTDPDPDLEKDILTIPLGNVSHFDQSLSFEASPFKRHAHDTVGSLRLKRPGNTTDTDGTHNPELWAQMLEFPFELIVRGVLRYQLPISARWQNAAVSSAITVHPEEGVDHGGSMRVEPIDRSGRWEWVEWPDERDDYESGLERMEGDAGAVPSPD